MVKDRWSQLSMSEKSDLMSLYIRNGIRSLEEIKKHYNSYQIGGPIPSKAPNFVQRFNEGNKRDVPVQGGHATHLLSYAERDGKYYVYPEVQPTDYNDSNSPLQYYGRDWRVAFDRAYDNNDYLEFDTEEAARNYSENYKKVPSSGAVLNGRNRGNYNILDYMRGFATGGQMNTDGPDWPPKKPLFKQSQEQYYDRNNDIIYAQDSIGEGYQHEYFHARPNTTLLNSLKPYYENLNDERLVQLGADLPFVKRLDNDPNHFYSPEEIGARVTAARYMLNKAGVNTIDIDFLRNARKNELQYGDNFRDLLHMYNDENLLQILNTQYSKGGHLYQDGGPDEPNFVGGATALKKDYNYELEHLADKYAVTTEGPWHDYGLHNPSSSQRAHWNELSRMYNRVAQRPDYQYLNPTNILEYTPVVGDAIDAGNSIYDLQQGNTGLGLAGLGMLALPNFIEKPLKSVGKSIKGLLKNNSQKQLDKVFDYYLEKLSDIEIQPQSNIRVISEPTVAFKTAPYKNTLKNYHPNWYPAEVSSPTGITHTISGRNLARVIENSNGMLPVPSLAISPWEGITKGRHPYSDHYSEDGLYTFVLNPEYIDNLPHEAYWRDAFTPTYKNAETWAGKSLTPSEVVDVKRDMYNTLGTVIGIQREADFIKHTRELPLDLYGKPYTSFSSQGLQEATEKVKKVPQKYGWYGEVMPLDFVDLRQAPIVFGEGSTNPIVSEFLKNLNHHKVTSPEMFNIKGLALKNGGNLKST